MGALQPRLLGRGQKTINHLLQGKRFREKLPSRIRLNTSKTALWETEFIKNEKHRIRVIELIQDKRIKLERAAIREAASLISKAPRAAQEAYFSGVLTMEQVEWALGLGAGKGPTTLSEIPPELKLEILNATAGLVRFRQDTREILADETNTEEEKEGVKKELEDFEKKLKEDGRKAREEFRSKYGEEVLRALDWWVDLAVIEKTLYLRNEPNGEEVQSSVLDFVGAYQLYDAIRRTPEEEGSEGTPS